MKTICSWCEEHLLGNPQDTEVSHGICETCEAKFNEQLDRIRLGPVARGAEDDWLTENLPETNPPMSTRPGAEYGLDV